MKRIRPLALVAVIALALVSCGDDDDDVGASSGASTTTPADSSSDDGGADGGPLQVDISACEDPDLATAVIEGDIKIGTSIPLSGGPAALFAPLGDAFSAYFEHINDTEGGVNGQRLVPIVKDDQYTADLTKANVDELLYDDEVALLASILGSPNNAAIIDDVNAQCVPHLWAATGHPLWGAVEAYPWTTGLIMPYSLETQMMLEFAKQELPEGGTAGLFYVNNEFGQAYADAFKEFASDYGFDVVVEETIDAADSGAPTAQLTNLVEADPDVVLAVPLGAQCISFLSELGNQRAANPELDSLVYLTATCLSPLFFNAAGEGANGVYTSSNLIDVTDPANASDPTVALYLEEFTAIAPDSNPGGIAVAGWLAAELTVEVLRQAAEAEGGLTRANIMNAARNLDYKPSVFRGDLRAILGAEDGYLSEGSQIVRWNAATHLFEDVGDIIDLEGTAGVYQP